MEFDTAAQHARAHTNKHTQKNTKHKTHRDRESSHEMWHNRHADDDSRRVSGRFSTQFPRVTTTNSKTESTLATQTLLLPQHRTSDNSPHTHPHGYPMPPRYGPQAQIPAQRCRPPHHTTPPPLQGYLTNLVYCAANPPSTITTATPLIILLPPITTTIITIIPYYDAVSAIPCLHKPSRPLFATANPSLSPPSLSLSLPRRVAFLLLLLLLYFPLPVCVFCVCFLLLSWPTSLAFFSVWFCVSKVRMCVLRRPGRARERPRTCCPSGRDLGRRGYFFIFPNILCRLPDRPRGAVHVGKGAVFRFFSPCPSCPPGSSH